MIGTTKSSISRVGWQERAKLLLSGSRCLSIDGVERRWIKPREFMWRQKAESELNLAVAAALMATDSLV